MTRTAFSVNGRRISADIEPRQSLADFLREEENLTGTHAACEHGVCGACTLLVDGRPVRSCITLAVAVDGSEVTTIEGYGDDPVMARLREAFKRCHAVQCGYCTPGMLATSYDIVRRMPGAGRDDIRRELCGNLCRCTGYVQIVDAVETAMGREPG